MVLGLLIRLIMVYLASSFHLFFTPYISCVYIHPEITDKTFILFYKATYCFFLSVCFSFVRGIKMVLCILQKQTRKLFHRVIYTTVVLWYIKPKHGA